jgi:hypothetical protein
MAEYLIPILSIAAFSIFMVSFNNCWPDYNRPRIFRKGFGEFIFSTLAIWNVIIPIWVTISAFKSTRWVVLIPIGIFTLLSSTAVSMRLPPALTQSALGIIIPAVIQTLLMHLKSRLSG